jgi:hypothetical protein
LPKPTEHPVNAQAPVAQVVPVAFAGAHTTPHAPQFVVVASPVSQPFAFWPSQLP